MRRREWRTNSEKIATRSPRANSARFHQSETTWGVALGLMPLGAFSAESSLQVVFTPGHTSN
jgi:hypothetical protein